MNADSNKNLLLKIKELEDKLIASEQLIVSMKGGLQGAVNESHTLPNDDYTYKGLIEELGDGAINVTEKGIIVYSNAAFIALLNLPYEKVIGQSLLSFVNAASVTQFEDLFKTALSGRSKGEISLAANDKVIPAFISLTSLQPDLNTVGIIITDFTEKKKSEEVILNYQKNLETKNLELLQSNAELGSFGYVASHDLQEPLRKIKMFANLIYENDGKNFSVSTRDYFQRIMASTNRMQDLIAALLSYSRAGTTETLFETVSLNWIIQTVEVNLRELIEEKKVIINIEPLPTLYIVPDQMVQLFTNIIGNAIKYSKQDVTPVIKISAGIVEPAEMIPVANIHARYWKITIADNGVGFNPKYGEKIFELFQRLHTESEYAGTGIGLAICKKIITNHKGFIKATGEEDAGSVFSIYLPVTEK